MGTILAAAASAASGISAVLSKKGMKGVNQYLVNAFTNTVVFLLFVMAVTVGGTFYQLGEIQHWGLICLSSGTLVISWLFYYLGLKDGSVGGVLAMQNLSILFTMLLETVLLKSDVSLSMLIGAAMIGTGTFLMVEKDEIHRESGSKQWIFYELISAMAIAASFIFTKMDDTAIDTNLASSIRYFAVAASMWVVVLLKGIQREIPAVRKYNWEYIFGGGLFLGIGYILFYKSIVLDSAALVTSIFRMNIAVSTLLSVPILKEKVSRRVLTGLGAMIIGVIVFALPA